MGQSQKRWSLDTRTTACIVLPPKTHVLGERLCNGRQGRDEMKGRSVGRSGQECNLFAVKCAEKSPPHDGDDDGGSEGRSYSHEGRSETKGPSEWMKQVAFSIWTKAVAGM